MHSAVSTGAYLHHLQIGSPDPARLAAYYRDALQTQVSTIGNVLLCTGPGRRTLFAPGQAGVLQYSAFACRDAQALAGLRAVNRDKGLALEASLSPLFGDEAFGVRDPEGNLMLFGLAGEEADTPRAIRGPIQHVTVTSTDLARMEAFYVDKLGFAVSDRVRNDKGVVTTVFFRCNHEHHTLGCFLKTQAGLDHHSYEAGEWITIRDWADHLATHRIPIVWGPGRHGPGNNLFIFIKDPDGNMIEISAELEVVNDRPVKEWVHEPYTLNMWGPAIMRS
ncbi:MAG: VOC family protein [Pseudolabrys sp.]